MKLQLTYQFDDEAELRAHLGATTATATPAPAPAQPTEAPAEEQRSETDLDADGMPYDSEVHSDPPNFTADGLWRARRGKAEEAKAARAAFKASGGDVEPPAILPAPPTLPGMPGAKAAALPVDAPAPISLDRVIEKITGMMKRDAIDEKTLTGLYAQHSGVADPADSFTVFNTNESARANLFSALCGIEPEMS